MGAVLEHGAYFGEIRRNNIILQLLGILIFLIL